MQAKKPESIIEKATRLMRQGMLLEEGHAIYQSEDRSITRRNIRDVIEAGRHVPQKDEYDPKRRVTKHAIEGVTKDGRRIRVVICFRQEDPVPEEFIYVLTAFWV